MVRSVFVVGTGRVGTAVAARLVERGLELRENGAELERVCRALAEATGP